MHKSSKEASIQDTQQKSVKAGSKKEDEIQFLIGKPVNHHSLVRGMELQIMGIILTQ